MEKVGVIAFAFGQQLLEIAGPSNEAVARVAIDVVHAEQQLGNDTFLSTQWEIALYCNERSKKPDHEVSSFNDPATHYINTKDALYGSLEYFKRNNIQRVIILAHPLHLWFIRHLIGFNIWRVEGFTFDRSYDKLLSKVPYDKSQGNHQWWTRGPVVFVTYLIKTLITKRHGS